MLDRNRIRYIDPDAFSSLGKLRELRLEENGLRSLANLQCLTGLQVRTHMLSELLSFLLLLLSLLLTPAQKHAAHVRNLACVLLSVLRKHREF